MTIQFTDFYYMSFITMVNTSVLLAFQKLYTCCLSRNYTLVVSVQDFKIFDQQSSSHFQIDQHSLKIQQVGQHHIAIIY